MLRIEIVDPSSTSANELRAVAACLIAIAEGQGVAAPVKHFEVRGKCEPVAPGLAEVKKSIDAQIKAFDAPIAAADRPDAGTPTIEPVAQGETLREPATVIDPKVAFGGNVPAATVSSIAVAAPSPIAPVVQPAISTTPAPATLPPVPAAPATVAPTAEDAPSDAQFDKNGLPWDARIHSRTRSLNSDGTWRAKRGVDDAAVAAVVAELRGVVTASDVDSAEASWPFTPPVPAAPAAPVPPAPPAPVITAAPVVADFPSFMARVVPAVAAGTISESQVTTILGEFGVPSLPLLAARPDLLPTVAARIDALIAGGQ